MRRDLSHTEHKTHDEKECLVNSASSQNETAISPPAAPTPDGGMAVEFPPDENNFNCEISNSTASLITCRAPFSNIDNIEYLTCGVDKLDIGFYVEWGRDWEKHF